MIICFFSLLLVSSFMRGERKGEKKTKNEPNATLPVKLRGILCL